MNAAAARAQPGGRFRLSDYVVLGFAVILFVRFLFPSGPADAPLPDLAALDTAARKAEFLDYLAPIVNAVNEDVLRERRRLQSLLGDTADPSELGWRDRRWIEGLSARYEVDLDESGDAAPLLEHVDIVPTGLTLAQAAIESGWGTSRFAVDGNNLFGQRCYEPGCGMRPQGRENARFGVARFDSVRDSVASYLRNLNSHPQYAGLRELRARLRANDEPLSTLRLAQGLDEYSERGDDYIADVRTVIRQNGLEHFDSL